MSGKVAVVTGATGGIGKEIARGLVRLGCNVVIGARDARRGEAARAELSAAGAAGVSVLTLDVADQSSLRSSATELRRVLRSGIGQGLDVLVNNAGAWCTDRRQSPD